MSEIMIRKNGSSEIERYEEGRREERAIYFEIKNTSAGSMDVLSKIVWLYHTFCFFIDKMKPV